MSREGKEQGSEDGVREGEMGKLNEKAPCSLSMPGKTGGKVPAVVRWTAHRELRQEKKALEFSLKVVPVGLLYSIHALSLVMEAAESVMQC